MYRIRAIRNHSQIVIIHKARILRKISLEKTFLEFKEWIKIYNAASMVIVSKYFLNGNPIWQTLSVKSFFSSWNKEKRSLTLLSMSHYLKFSFSEKATKIWKNIPLVLTLLSKNRCFVKTSGRFFFQFCGLLTMS